MIKLLKKGEYVLGETKSHTKFIYLDSACYVWISVPSIGDILSLATTKHTAVIVLSQGLYKLYDIKNETDLVDLKHLELEVSKGHWQGYLLLTGLPQGSKRRSRIIPTTEKVADYMKSAHRRARTSTKSKEVVS